MLPSWKSLSWLPLTSLGIVSYPPFELKARVRAIILVELGLLVFMTSRSELFEGKAPVFLCCIGTQQGILHRALLQWK